MLVVVYASDHTLAKSIDFLVKAAFVYVLSLPKIKTFSSAEFNNPIQSHPSIRASHPCSGPQTSHHFVRNSSRNCLKYIRMSTIIDVKYYWALMIFPLRLVPGPYFIIIFRRMSSVTELRVQGQVNSRERCSLFQENCYVQVPADVRTPGLSVF